MLFKSSFWLLHKKDVLMQGPHYPTLSGSSGSQSHSASGLGFLIRIFFSKSRFSGRKKTLKYKIKASGTRQNTRVPPRNVTVTYLSWTSVMTQQHPLREDSPLPMGWHSRAYTGSYRTSSSIVILYIELPVWLAKSFRYLYYSLKQQKCTSDCNKPI